MERQLITVPGVEPPAWYSPAVRYGDVVWASGHVAIRPDGSVPETIVEQVHVTLDNLAATLAAAGASFDTLLKLHVSLTSMDDFAAYNEVYLERLSAHGLPARATVQAGLAPGFLVEIEAVAHVA